VVFESRGNNHLPSHTVYNSPELVDSFNFLNTTIPIVFSHASYLTATGAALLRSTNQYVSTCPESEVFSGINHALHENFQDQTALGVDGQSDWSADILTQARQWLGKIREVEYTKVNDDFHVPKNSAMSVNQAFLLATRHGGLAFRREDLGIIAVGAKADLVVFDGDSPGMLGWLDPVEAVIQHSNVGDVEHVIVNGKFVKRDFKLLVKDYNSIKKRFVGSARRIQRLWKEIPYPVLEGLFLGVSEYADTETVDTLRGPGDGMGEPNLF
jgi:cytosine/adenosine deaminase-related metal-dependent hydrolase